MTPSWRQPLFSLVEPVEYHMNALTHDTLLERLHSQETKTSFQGRLVEPKSDTGESSKFVSCSMSLAERPICQAARLIRPPAIMPTAFELEKTTGFALNDGGFAVLVARPAKHVAVASRDMEEGATAQVYAEDSSTGASCLRS